MILIKNHARSILAPLTHIIIGFLAIALVLLSIDNTTVNAAPEDQKVYDYYGLFTDEEIAQLEEISQEYGEKGQVDIVTITTDNLEGKSTKQYLEDFYDAYGFGYDMEFGDTAMILINMDPNNRDATIQGYGDAEYYINNDRIEYILDDIIRILRDGNYYNAIEEFAKQVSYYMNQEKGVNTSPATGDPGSGKYYGESSYSGPSDYYGDPDNIFFNTFFQLAIALVIGAIVVMIMAFQSGGKITVNNRTYLDDQHSRVVASQDDYIRTTTTRIRKPTNNTKGGGRSSGGGGISSGGHSHSGGSRGF